MKNRKAFFVRLPRRIKDLQKPHMIRQERPYAVVAEAVLTAIDYNNFISDMVADRQFIEDSASLCAEGEVMKCILVRRYNSSDGVLVVPDSPDYKAHIKWAAYVAAINA